MTIGLFVLLLVCLQSFTLIANNNLVAKSISNDENTPQNVVTALKPQNSALSLNNTTGPAPSTQEILSSQQTSSSNSNYLNNFSIDNLYTYLANIYDSASYTFKSTTGSNNYATALTYMQALAILKMSGLENYILANGENEKFSIANNFNLSANCVNSNTCGFPIVQTQKSSSLSGTFGTLMTFYLLSLESSLKIYAGQSSSYGPTMNYILSRLFLNSTNSGFTESFDPIGSLPISSTYWGVESLALLQPIVHYAINNSVLNGIINTLKNQLYHQGNNYYFNDSTIGVSSILKSFYAVSILQALNNTYPTQFMGNNNATALFTQLQTGLPDWLVSLQRTSGKFIGGLQAPESIQPNIIDTGAALAIFDMLNTSSTQFNVSNAIQFILRSQYNLQYSAANIGGWGQNNATFLPNVTPDVNVENTFYAILGLYSSGYITANLHFSIETEYSRNNNNNYYNNSMIAGVAPASLYLKASLFNNTSFVNSFTDLTFPLFHIDNWNITLNQTLIETVSTKQFFIYYFSLEANSSGLYNWTWGRHNAFIEFQLSNFTFLPNKPISLLSFVIVRPDFSVLLNNTNNFSPKPGGTINGVISLDNTTLNPNDLVIAPTNFGVFQTDLIYPNGTSVPVNTTTVNVNVTTYTFKTTLPVAIPLGDYNINVTLINGTTIFYSRQQFRVSDNIILSTITGTKIGGLVTLYPGFPVNLKFGLAYATYTRMVNTSAYANFINNATKQQVFSVKLVYEGGIIYGTSSNAVVPKQLIMGLYNITINLIWPSSIVKTSFNSTVSNSTLQYVHIDGTVIPYRESLSPSSTISYGETLNFTTQLQIKANNTIIFVNQSYELAGEIYSSQSSTLIQTLTYSLSKNSTGQLIGRLDSNLLNSTNGNPYYYLVVKVRLNSTQTFISLQDVNSGHQYMKVFNLSGDLKIDKNSIMFLTGGLTTNIVNTPVIIMNFNVINNNNLTVAGLNLNATISFTLSNGTKINATFNNPIVAIENGGYRTYQIQISTASLKEGSYQLNIFTVKAIKPNTFIGSITFQIANTPIQPTIPIENYIATLTLGFAVIITLLSVYVNRKKQV